jgi:hypothetical protein
MNRAGGVEKPRMGFCGGNNAALGNLDNVVAERLRHGVQGQRAVDEPLNEVEAAHCSLLVVIDDSEAFARGEFRHEFHRERVDGTTPTIGSRQLTFDRQGSGAMVKTRQPDSNGISLMAV